MTSNNKGKGWIILAGVLLFVFVFSLFIPSILAHFVKQKLEALVGEKTPYYLKIGQLTIEGWNELSLTEIHLVPKEDKSETEGDQKYEADWVKLSIQSIEISGWKWKELYQHQRFMAAHIVLEQPEIYAYRDKQKPNKAPKFKALPSRLLRETNLIVTVPLIELRNGKLTYEEVSEKGGKSVSVSFTELHGTVAHLSTDSSYYSKEPLVTVDATGKVLGVIPATLTYSSSTPHPKDAFTLEGTLASYDAALLNPYVEPQASISIKSGRVDSLWFKLEADNDVAEGIMRLDYRDLKIEAKPHKKPKKLVALKSLFSKLFVKKENQAMEQKNVGHIHFERNKNRFIFNYIWNSFKSGFASVIIQLPDKLIQHQIQKKAEKHTKYK